MIYTIGIVSSYDKTEEKLALYLYMVRIYKSAQTFNETIQKYVSQVICMTIDPNNPVQGIYPKKEISTQNVYKLMSITPFWVIGKK